MKTLILILGICLLAFGGFYLVKNGTELTWLLRYKLGMLSETDRNMYEYGHGIVPENAFVLPDRFIIAAYSSRGVIFNLVINENWDHRTVKSTTKSQSTGSGPIVFVEGDKMIHKGKNKFEIEIIEIDSSAEPMLKLYAENISKDGRYRHGPPERNTLNTI